MKTTEFDTSVNNFSRRPVQLHKPLLEVRRLTPEDAPAYIDVLARNEERMSRRKYFLLKHLGDAAALADRIAAGEDRRAIIIDGSIAGGIDFTPTTNNSTTEEVSYWVDKEVKGRKLAAEALSLALIEKDDAAITVIAEVEQDNFPSMSTLETNKFREGRMKDGMYSYIHSPPQRD